MGVHLMTGFPGFIASQLIRQLFMDGVTRQIYAVVLQSEMDKARKEVANIKAQYPNCQINLFEGDITLPNLGMDNSELGCIAPRISIVWHLAAIHDLAVARELAWKVNVHGTACVNDFVRTLPNLKRYIYFSTAYVAGRRNGRLLENELIRPVAFKNHYEETKFEAELRVEDLKCEVPLTIIRPGIVRGHSETGETIKFDGLYFLFNMIDTLSTSPLIPYIGSKRATINVVPVDYILKAVSYICTAVEAEGKTLHLTDPNPHKVSDVYYAIVKEMTGKRPFGRLPLSMVKKVLANYKIRKRLGLEYETVDYLAWKGVFDTSEAQSILQKRGIKCPDFIETVPTMVRFYKDNKHRTQLFIPIK
ncbi:SDR family oxidoreductase [Lysinibacillus sp. KU-BSD001]|uniref:SDR family oxidoreductase n=1 Tax=Lysinibacillus sp. KU-BSD001 TaxID=3141328 RepID=UPI0036E8103A